MSRSDKHGSSSSSSASSNLTSVEYEIAMDLTDENFDYGNFIEGLREYFVGNGSDVNRGNIRYLGKAHTTFVDVRLIIDEGTFILVRLKTSDVYFIAWARGENGKVIPRWFVMDDGTNVEEIRTREEIEDGWQQTKLKLKNTYGDQALGKTKITDCEVSKEGMQQVLLGMHKYLPATGVSSDLAAKGGLFTAITIAEPLRYFVLQHRIGDAWKVSKAYEFHSEDQEIMNNWSDLAAYLEEGDDDPKDGEIERLQKEKEQKEEELKKLGRRRGAEIVRLQEAIAQDDAELLKLATRMRAYRKWQRIMGFYGVTMISELCAMLKKGDIAQAAEAAAAAEAALAAKKGGIKLPRSNVRGGHSQRGRRRS